MYYTVYKIINQINGKIYIGRHQTSNLDDGYMSSSMPIKQAIVKYGIDNFQKEYLHVFETLDEMIEKEKELVNETFIHREDVYNISVGGLGTSNWLHPEISKKSSMKGSKALEKRRLDEPKWAADCDHRISQTMKTYYENTPGTFTGRKHTDETKKKMSDSSKGKYTGVNSSGYGTMWIYSSKEQQCVKIKKGDKIPIGWQRGRKMKF